LDNRQTKITRASMAEKERLKNRLLVSMYAREHPIIHAACQQLFFTGSVKFELCAEFAAS
jgi:hypothetical protein